MPRMEKIVIIGSAGAGKSTFARRLGAILDIEVFHLDRYFWGANWREKTPSERKRIQHGLMMSKGRWIIEGTYLDTSDERLSTADMIIFLDTHVLICLWRVFKRRMQDYNKSRLDLPLGCTEKLRLAYILKVLVFPLKGRRLLFQKLYRVRNLNLAHLSSQKHVELFLQRIATQQLSTGNKCFKTGEVQDYTAPYQSIPEWTHDIGVCEILQSGYLPKEAVSFS